MLFKTKIKEFVKDWLLSPMVLYFINNWVLGIRHFSTLQKLDKKSRRLFVLATGPSFNEDLKRYKESIQTEDAVAMNMLRIILFIMSSFIDSVAFASAASAISRDP